MSTVTGNPNRRAYNYFGGGALISENNLVTYGNGILIAGTALSTTATLVSGTTYYTTPISTVGCDGVFSIQTKHTSAGAGTLTIGYQCGSDFEGWAAADFSGTSGLVIATTLAKDTLRLDSFTAPYWGQMRFTLLPGTADITAVQFIVTWK